ncbi:MAG: type II toxin-antitoxin system RelE/ParE family toxin [Bacteroidia bacterium]
MKKFDVLFLEEAEEFLDSVEEKARRKILFNITKASMTNDPVLLKKLNAVVWEFRTKYQGKEYRLFAFWDKRDKKNTLVISTHGLIKKTQKTPQSHILKTERIAQKYLNQ